MSRVPTSRLAFVLVFSVAACAQTSDRIAASAEAIVNGALETGEPWVVAVHHPSPTSATAIRLCTGAVVGARAVLTAKHCVFDGSGSGPWDPVEPSALTVSVGNDISSPDGIASEVGVSEIHTTPGPYMRADALSGNDIAVLLVDADIDAPSRPWSREPPSAGDTIFIAGFGLTETDELGVKHSATAMVSDLRDGVFESRGDAWTCTGDSGGPALSTHTGRLVGVTSIGPSGCTTSTSYYTRIDRQAAWLDDVLGSSPTLPPAPPAPAPDAGSGSQPDASPSDAPWPSSGSDAAASAPAGASSSGGCAVSTRAHPPSPAAWLFPAWLAVLTALRTGRGRRGRAVNTPRSRSRVCSG